MLTTLLATIIFSLPAPKFWYEGSWLPDTAPERKVIRDFETIPFKDPSIFKGRYQSLLAKQKKSDAEIVEIFLLAHRGGGFALMPFSEESEIRNARFLALYEECCNRKVSRSIAIACYIATSASPKELPFSKEVGDRIYELEPQNHYVAYAKMYGDMKRTLKGERRPIYLKDVPGLIKSATTVISRVEKAYPGGWQSKYLMAKNLDNLFTHSSSEEALRLLHRASQVKFKPSDPQYVKNALNSFYEYSSKLLGK